MIFNSFKKETVNQENLNSLFKCQNDQFQPSNQLVKMEYLYLGMLPDNHYSAVLGQHLLWLSNLCFSCVSKFNYCSICISLWLKICCFSAQPRLTNLKFSGGNFVEVFDGYKQSLIAQCARVYLYRTFFNTTGMQFCLRLCFRSLIYSINKVSNLYIWYGWKVWGFVQTYPYSFENATLFLCFQKKIRFLTWRFRIVSASPYVYDESIFENDNF